MKYSLVSRQEVNWKFKPRYATKSGTAANWLLLIMSVKTTIFCNHHTPKMYGFQSYISVPIILKTGEFFGTLCSIDPRPASLNNSKTIGMFTLFADLISFHLQSLDLMDQSHKA